MVFVTAYMAGLIPERLRAALPRLSTRTFLSYIGRCNGKENDLRECHPQPCPR
jgi:hypothetical protein